MTATRREAERLNRLYGVPAVPIEVWLALVSALVHFISSCRSDDPDDVQRFAAGDEVDERRTRKRFNRIARRCGVPKSHRPAVVGLLIDQRKRITRETWAGLIDDERTAKILSDDTGEWPAVK